MSYAQPQVGGHARATAPHGEKPLILIVEDDEAIATGLTDALQFEGYEVSHVSTAEAGLRQASLADAQCIILDIMLPGMNGFEFCERIREVDSATPIIVLSARSEEADRIRGLESGADDYVSKPFSISELVARVRAMFRRAERMNRTRNTTPFVVGEAQVDPNAQTVTRGNKCESLSFHEIELLRLLKAQQGVPVARDTILERVWGFKPGASSRTVDNFIVKLRKKIEPDPERPAHILTIYGVGYKLVESP